MTNESSKLLLRTSLVEQSSEVGVFVIGSEATIEWSVVRDTIVNPAGHFGDGVSVVSVLGFASATVTSTHIERSARAALVAHGAHAAIAGSAFSCQVLDLDRETYQGIAATLEDLGGNFCGCPEATARCIAVSGNLEPPEAIPSP